MNEKGLPAPRGPREVAFRRQHGRFDDAAKQRYLEAYAQEGVIGRAALAVGVSRQSVYRHMETDEAFKLACVEARWEFLDRLHNEAVRRGEMGVTEDIYFKGHVVGQKLVYSDRLLELLLKARHPDFKEKLQVDANVKVGVMLIGAPIASSDDWAAQANRRVDAPHTTEETDGEA